MEKEILQEAAKREHLSDAARVALSERPVSEPHGGGHMSHSVREAEYKGHTIRIETTYHITVDGEPIMGHVMVGNNGRVHYHSVPNQEFVSAVDMVKRLIDLMPPAEGGHSHQGGPGHEHPPQHHH